MLMVWPQTVKKRVFEAIEGSDVERNEKGEVTLHGCTFFAWATRI